MGKHRSIVMSRPLAAEEVAEIESGTFYIEGSRAGKCTDCGVTVGIAPTSVPLLAAGAILCCIPCAMKRAKRNGEFEGYGFTTASIEEASRVLGISVEILTARALAMGLKVIDNAEERIADEVLDAEEVDE